MQTAVGFIGLGVMGTPMALNLARAGTPLVVWSRSHGSDDALRDAGARVAEHVDDVFATCRTVILMLANDAAIDGALARGTPGFAARVGGHTIVNMGTNAPEYSRALADDIAAASGRYVESARVGVAQAGRSRATRGDARRRAGRRRRHPRTREAAVPRQLRVRRRTVGADNEARREPVPDHDGHRPDRSHAFCATPRHRSRPLRRRAERGDGERRRA